MSSGSAAVLGTGGDALPRLRPLIAPYERPHLGRALWHLANTAVPYAALWWLMYRSLGTYWLTLLLAFPTAGLLIRLFIVQHDCGHGSFFASPRANDMLGRLCGVLTMTPYRFWQRFHAGHHATSSKLDQRSQYDLMTLTVREYVALSRWGRLKYRALRNPIALFALAPIVYYVLVMRWPWLAPASWKRERRSILGTNAGIALHLGLLAWLVGLKAMVAVQLPIMVVAASTGMWLFYVQHQFEETYWADGKAWDYTLAAMQGSSYYALPPVLRWFTGNIGLHHLHHLSTRIPSYRLMDCFRNHAELRAAPSVGLIESLRCARLKLWDEEQRRLVGWPVETNTRPCEGEPRVHPEGHRALEELPRRG